MSKHKKNENNETHCWENSFLMLLQKENFEMQQATSAIQVATTTQKLHYKIKKHLA